MPNPGAIIPAFYSPTRGVKRMRTAYRVATHPTTQRAAKKIAKWVYKRYKARNDRTRRTIPSQQGSSRAKTTQSNQATAFPVRTLQTIAVEFGNMGDNYGSRTGHTIRMRGLRHCWIFENRVEADAIEQRLCDRDSELSRIVVNGRRNVDEVGHLPA